MPADIVVVVGMWPVACVAAACRRCALLRAVAAVLARLVAIAAVAVLHQPGLMDDVAAGALPLAVVVVAPVLVASIHLCLSLDLSSTSAEQLPVCWLPHAHLLPLLQLLLLPLLSLLVPSPAPAPFHS